MTKHTGLPVAGYNAQSDSNVILVNENKAIEERVLRQIDKHREAGSSFDQRMVALANTKIQEAFMWLNRAVFQPSRIALPEEAMIGHVVESPEGRGTIDAASVQPDGEMIYRVNDHWFPLSSLTDA